MYFYLAQGCEHSLHHEGKERGFQQLGPGLHLVAGGVSRLVGSSWGTYINIIESATISATIAGIVAGIVAAAPEASVIGNEECFLFGSETGESLG